ncbi:Crp/Fnr family transcriptional regulator [Sphaerochaeta globosa]|uniref:Transcriptional regulator, Crp/Fnr family n=1 Tax=Sphaerochaeta globosa (strain ATCC BAA-1886 / DSM 22777 / Buddy) TaxID=158189 RepID=F0RXG0_SPHGB|nr:Crp/Fnr family transcriptional regulator [Sphaerochaeta globosa]ADY12010.1 transcriptional regulator, Crp/Fnr family [Sphaerochaeta globosa str. Buddy]
MDIVQSLGTVALFQCFSDEALASFVKEGGITLVHFCKDQLVAVQGELCTTLDVVLEGSLSLQSIDDDGNVFKARVLEAGEIWGATLLFSRCNHYPMQVVCDRACSIVRLKKSLVLSLCTKNREFLVGLLQIISDRAHELGLTLTKRNEQTLRQSLLDYLTQLSLQQGSNTILLPTSKKELADRLGFARTSLSREFSNLQSEGILRFRGRSVQLHISSRT